MTTPSVPPPPPASSVAESPASLNQKRGRGGTVAALLALFLLVTTIIATSLWIWNYNSARSWEEAAADARVERDVAESELAGAESKAETLEAASSTMRDQISTLEGEAAGVAKQAADLEEQEARLAEREAAVTKTEDQVAATTITEGVWTVGVDIEAGNYRVKESPIDCYWAIYTTGTNQDDIIQNDIVTGGMPTVTIREGQDFESNRCGSWIKQ
ncbi:hypothetical protein [Cellulosimicrobium arenosum]|uniref:Uncharacterized protein n=1 Tax=Cellulosimicrobium arenosum TaxID=2708133 RepID=A0A927J076_9MICO|nr:hypothetical protein [Cellulosimicrobium arenosum]MBD8079357.1 hypothetical protein [Cellulosimicrobium arenosum]